MPHRFLISSVVVALLCLSSDGVGAEQPNILFILADDLAWSDLGCYGHPWHETPHLDRLAADGVRFTDAYASAPICSASRASILTGKTPARLHFEFVTKNEAGQQKRQPTQTLHTPPFTLNLPLDEMTIAEQLCDAGYSTAFFGKWHLNAHHGQYLGWSPTHGPKQQGFQVAEEGFGSHPYSYRSGGKPAAIEQIGRYPADAVTDRACAYLEKHYDGPFFLTVSHFYVHTPVDTRCQWLLEKYEQRVPADSPNRERRVKYAAFVETLDHYVGQLLAKLDAAGLRDSTFVVFTSDNGGHPQYTANGPLRGSKWNLYEGGIRVPLIARWPQQLPAKGTSSTPVVGYDLAPTFAAAAGSKLKKGNDAIDGVSLLGVMRDPTRPMERELYWHFPYYHPESGFAKSRKQIGIDDFAVSQTRPHSAVRRGDFKLLHFYENQQSELYNLRDDMSEQKDLSSSNQPVSDQLQQSLMTYLDTAAARRPKPLAKTRSAARRP